MPACGESLSTVPLPLQPRPASAVPPRALCIAPHKTTHHTPDPRPTAH
jgi:hypothetical protein